MRYRYRVYPTPRQQQILERTFGCARLVYNTMLEIRESDFQQNLPYRKLRQLSKLLTELKQDPEWAFLQNVSCIALQQALRQLDRAYNDYFHALEKLKKGETKTLQFQKPTYRRKHGLQSVEYSRKGMYEVRQQRNARWGFVNLAKLGEVKFRSTRMLPSYPSSCVILREPDGRWYVSFVVRKPQEPYMPVDNMCGVDAGCRRLATTVDTNGRIATHENPRANKQIEHRKAVLQRRQSHMIQGSNNWIKTQVKINRLEAKARHIRRDTLMKTAATIVHDNQVIVVETLHVADMIKQGPAQKAVQDAGMATLLQCIDEQADKHARIVVHVPADYPSTARCSQCGHIADVPFKTLVWQCDTCDAVLDRDTNACVNLLDAAGLAESLNALKANPALWEPSEKTHARVLSRKIPRL